MGKNVGGIKCGTFPSVKSAGGSGKMGTGMKGGKGIGMMGSSKGGKRK